MGAHRCAAAMGFDPRTWAAASPRGSERPGPRVTVNLEALLAENQALQREVALLRRELAEREGPRPRPPRREAPGPRRRGVTTGFHHGISERQLALWVEAMGRHPRWGELRLGAGGSPGGPPARGLRGLLVELEGRASGVGGDLEERLDRHAPGMGQELRAVLRGSASRGKLAVRAAFALYGTSALERLNGDPLLVVEALLEAVARLEARQRPPSGGGRPGSGRRESASREPAGGAAESRRDAALRELGLEPGATRQAIKAAHRRLVKRHHPDVGGDAEEFRRINDAYQQLLA
ncbi:MAG: J domain-containing protein [Cyanobium sp.]